MIDIEKALSLIRQFPDDFPQPLFIMEITDELYAKAAPWFTLNYTKHECGHHHLNESKTLTVEQGSVLAFHACHPLFQEPLWVSWGFDKDGDKMSHSWSEAELGEMGQRAKDQIRADSNAFVAWGINSKIARIDMFERRLSRKERLRGIGNSKFNVVTLRRFEPIKYHRMDYQGELTRQHLVLGHDRKGTWLHYRSGKVGYRIGAKVRQHLRGRGPFVKTIHVVER